MAIKKCHCHALRESISSELIEAIDAAQISIDNSTMAYHELLELLKILQHALLNEKPIDLALRILNADKKQLPAFTKITKASAKKELNAIRARRALKREKHLFRGSKKLDPYRKAILLLYEQGASQNDIREKLRHDYKCNVSQTTIHKFLKPLGILRPNKYKPKSIKIKS